MVSRQFFCMQNEKWNDQFNFLSDVIHKYSVESILVSGSVLMQEGSARWAEKSRMRQIFRKVQEMFNSPYSLTASNVVIVVK